LRIKAVEFSTAFLLFDALAKNHFLLNIFQKSGRKICIVTKIALPLHRI
jgi:hypothetical protein